MHYRVRDWVAIQRSHAVTLSVITLLGFMERMPDIFTESVPANMKGTHYT
jgi:hypothetical protein